jgi:hypothetical protein
MYTTTAGLKGTDLEKGMFSGERVFAVTNGPSSKTIDWSRLTNEYLWGCGISYEMKEPDHFDFYSVTEQARLPIVEPKIRDLDIPKFYNKHFEAEDLFKRHGFANDPTPVGWKETEAIHHGVDTIPQLGFSADLDYVCHIPEASAISGVLQPALWLGFTEIYLIGADFSGTYAGAGHRPRNVYPNKWISYVVSAAADEVEKNFPEVTFANIADKSANPSLHAKFPMTLKYTTLEEVLG